MPGALPKLARMVRKKKRLPKDFDTTLRSGDLDAMKAVFETTELDARDGAHGPTALGMSGIPPELVAWLVAEGADIEATDTYHRTALWQHAALASAYRRDSSEEETQRLSELAVSWVIANPDPLPAPGATYSR